MLLWHVQLCLQLSLFSLLYFARGENCKFHQLHVRVQPISDYMARRRSSYKKWVLAHFEINFDFKSTHEFKIDFKSTLKSSLISKNSSCTF